MADEEKSGADEQQSRGRLTKILATIFGGLIAPLIVAVSAKWVDPSLWKPTTPASTSAPMNRRAKAPRLAESAPPAAPTTKSAPTKSVPPPLSTTKSAPTQPAPPTTQATPKAKPVPATPPSPPVAPAPSEGTYVIVNASSGKAIVPGLMPTANHGEPVLGPPRGGGAKAGKRWQLVKTKHGYLIKNADTGLSLVANRQTAKDPRGTTTYWGVKGDGAPDQNWTLTKTQFGYLIKNAQSGRALVPTLATMKEDGGKLLLVDLKTPSGMDHQNWKVIPKN